MLHEYSQELCQIGDILLPQLACILAAAQLSEQHYCFTTFIDHVFDEADRLYAVTSSGLDAESIVTGCAVLHASRGFAEGLLLSASIGTRTMVGRQS